MFDSQFLHAWDLRGKVCVVQIREVIAGTLTGEGGRKTRKPVVRFERTEKALALNKTNAKTIATMFGNDTSKWIGKRITLYATRTTFGKDEVDAIRVRPEIPKSTQAPEGIETAPVDEEMRARQQAAAASAAQESTS